MATKLNSSIFITKTVFTISTLILLTSCGSIGLSNPFGSRNKELSRTPENAIAYECEGNKRFYVRMQTNGTDAWLIYPDHEVNLPKQADGRYSNGSAVFSPSAENATLTDGEKVNYTACVAQVKAVK